MASRLSLRPFIGPCLGLLKIIIARIEAALVRVAEHKSLVCFASPQPQGFSEGVASVFSRCNEIYLETCFQDAGFAPAERLPGHQQPRESEGWITLINWRLVVDYELSAMCSSEM